MGNKYTMALFWLFTLLICGVNSNRDEALRIMESSPVIDGHNDLPWQLLIASNNQLSKVDLFTVNTTHTNIPKLREGKVGGQFWAAYVPCDTQGKDAVKRTLEQIDVIHRMCQKYPDDFLCVTTAGGIVEAIQNKKVASLIGVEGGHSIDSSLAVLRTFYHLGVRYMTLTHSCNVPWVDNWLVDTNKDPAKSNGLSEFGKKEKKGLVMVNFYNDYVTCKTAANLSDVADHFDHIKKIAGNESVGFGGDYDGVPRVPDGLKDVSKYPDLVAELLRRGWTQTELQAALTNNLIRVFNEVEKTSISMNSAQPADDPIDYKEIKDDCRTSYGYDISTGTTVFPHVGKGLLLIMCLFYPLSL